VITPTYSPIRPVTANMGIEMPSWYVSACTIPLSGTDVFQRFDIYSFGFNTDEDEKGMLESVSDINALIAEEVNSGLDPSRIILGGFSQGGTMSLLTGLTSERKLGGLVVLSGWLPLRNKFKTVSNIRYAIGRLY
jgi:lysophospholipase-1